MCGIIGYVGERDALEILLEGLRRLEYRGYDSAGVAVLQDGRLEVRRSPGKIKNLEAILQAEPLSGRLGVGHTRWATHGRPSEENAHPHTDCSGTIVVVHNGILENYLELRERLRQEGHVFKSETDTEVIAHLIEKYLPQAGSLEAATRTALREVRGAYALGIISAGESDTLVAARSGAGGLVVGLGAGEHFIASDIPAILPHTRDVLIIEDDELAVCSRAGVRLSRLDSTPVTPNPVKILWDPIMAEKGGYRHFMLKEIYEQPRAVTDTFRGRVAAESGTVFLPDAGLVPEDVERLSRVVLVACGTSYHAALVGRAMIERLAGLPGEVDIGSEFRYRDPLIGPDTLVVALSQSGETVDTLAAVRAAKAKGASILAVTNVVGSALTREAQGVVYTHAGPEIGVASTKTFTATMTALYVLALFLARARAALPVEEGRKRVQELVGVPRLIEAVLALDEPIAELAKRLFQKRDFLYIGRGINYPIALEGALKLKEISYIHAEGYPAGEMKHGPIALIDETVPVLALVPGDPTRERMLANIEEVKARDGLVVALGHEDDQELRAKVDHLISVPRAPDLLMPILLAIPLQLLAYHIAIRLGCDVDQPRNLAKSVTVE